MDISRGMSICKNCGGLYVWCEHVGTKRQATFEEARVVAANLLLRIRFGDARPWCIINSETITRQIYEVFGASEEVT